jgi:hypothetical protein
MVRRAVASAPALMFVVRRRSYSCARLAPIDDNPWTAIVTFLHGFVMCPLGEAQRAGGQLSYQLGKRNRIRASRHHLGDGRAWGRAAGLPESEHLHVDHPGHGRLFFGDEHPGVDARTAYSCGRGCRIDPKHRGGCLGLPLCSPPFDLRSPDFLFAETVRLSVHGEDDGNTAPSAICTLTCRKRFSVVGRACSVMVAAGVVSSKKRMDRTAAGLAAAAPLDGLHADHRHGR